jgi:ferritin-like metal-binding protein YciE
MNRDLETLLSTNLQELYSMEMAISKILPTLIDSATNPELKESLQEHFGETLTHLARLEQIDQAISFGLDLETPPSINALLEEGQEKISSFEGTEIIDAAIIAATRRVEHYEMGSYLPAIAIAEELELDTIAELLEASFKEEEHADDTLADISEDVHKTIVMKGLD